MDELFVDLPETQLFVRAWGEPDARPVLYWHGVFIAPRGSMTINEAGPWLAEHGLRVLALDAPGFGKSPALEPAAYHPQALAAIVPQLLDAVGVERAPFVGFSWGGDIGCHVAARHPERVSGLAILDAGYSDVEGDESRDELVHRFEADQAAFAFESWDAYFAWVRGRVRNWRPRAVSSLVSST